MTLVDITGVPDACPAGTALMHEHWDALRAVRPVAWSKRLKAWLVISHAAAMEAFRDPALGTDSYSANRPSPLPLPSSFELDSETNRRLQLAVSSCVSLRALPMAPIRSACDEMLDQLPLGRIVDFAGEVAEPIARSVTRRWLGVNNGTFDRWLGLFAAARSESAPERRAAASRLVIAELLELIAARRRYPTDDLVSRLASAWSSQDLDDEALVSFIAPMFHSLSRAMGGRLITHAAWNLASRPDLQRRIRSDGWNYARAVVLEAARLDPVNQAAPRRARESTVLSGQRISDGDQVCIVLPAVCRDPDAYPAPHEFRPGRRERHLAFGHGPHVCTGRELALATAATTLTELIDHRGVGFRPAPSTPPRVRFEFGRSCIGLPLVMYRWQHP